MAVECASFGSCVHTPCTPRPPMHPPCRAPLLEDVFIKFPTLKWVVDIKVKTPGLVAAINKLVVEHKKERQVGP